MLDFTSASYLGSGFSSIKFDIETRLTIGKPAFLKEPSLNRWVGNQIAKMQGLERGIIAPSSLHLFWDIFGILNKEYVIFIEENTYPIGHWGTIHADFRNFQIIRFQSENLEKLNDLVKKNCKNNQKPLIVCDAFDIDSGLISPIQQYLSIIQPFNGNLLIDDTQTFGIFGKKHLKNQDFGIGGGGVLPFLNLKSDKILSITSLSKAFGIPIAVLAGNEKVIKGFEKNSLTRVHSSPVSTIHALATAHTIKKNQSEGDKTRQKLWNNLLQFRKNIAKLDSVSLIGGIFPVQKILLKTHTSPFLIYQKLLETNIECLLLAPTKKQTNPCLAFCIRADHSTNEIEILTSTLQNILKKEIPRKAIFNQKTSNYLMP